jgi:hypothetical protein
LPLRLDRDPQVEGGHVFRPQEEVLFQLDLLLRDQAERLEGVGQVVFRGRLVRAGDAQVGARPQARCGRQVFNLAATPLT